MIIRRSYFSTHKAITVAELISFPPQLIDLSPSVKEAPASFLYPLLSFSFEEEGNENGVITASKG